MKTTHLPEPEILTYLQRRLERHFLTCTVAVGAAAALVPMQDAKGDIVYFDVNLQVPLESLAGIYLNLETGAFGFSAAGTPGWDVNIFNYGGNLATYTTGSGAGILGYSSGLYNYSSRLANGDGIGPASNFIFGGVNTMSYGGAYGPWVGDVSGFLGVNFVLSGGGTAFGWISLDVVDSTDATITGFAWENNGGQIAAGAIPEPSSVALSLLAAGAAGIGYWRRRKAA